MAVAHGVSRFFLCTERQVSVVVVVGRLEERFLHSQQQCHGESR